MKIATHPVALEAVLRAKVALLAQLLAVWTLQRACVVLAVFARTLARDVTSHFVICEGNLVTWGGSTVVSGPLNFALLYGAPSNMLSGIPSSAQKMLVIVFVDCNTEDSHRNRRRAWAQAVQALICDY